MMRVARVVCSCGGRPEPSRTTDDEEREHGCGQRGHCVVAYICPSCGTRWTFALEAPEME